MALAGEAPAGGVPSAVAGGRSAEAGLAAVVAVAEGTWRRILVMQAPVHWQQKPNQLQFKTDLPLSTRMPRWTRTTEHHPDK